MEASDNVTFDSVIVLGFQSFFPTLFKFKPFVIFFFPLLSLYFSHLLWLT